MNDTGIIHSTQTDAALGTSQIGKCDVNQLAGGQLDKIQRGRIIPEVIFTYFQPLHMIISKSIISEQKLANQILSDDGTCYIVNTRGNVCHFNGKYCYILENKSWV